MNITSNIAMQVGTIRFMAISRGPRAKLVVCRAELAAPLAPGDIRKSPIRQSFGPAESGAVGYSTADWHAGTSAPTTSDGRRSEDPRGRPPPCLGGEVGPAGRPPVPSRIRFGRARGPDPAGADGERGDGAGGGGSDVAVGAPDPGTT